LEEKIAQSLTRSNSGRSASSANASTLRLKSNQDSSRLKNLSDWTAAASARGVRMAVTAIDPPRL
jgi:hypothetical protein